MTPSTMTPSTLENTIDSTFYVYCETPSDWLESFLGNQSCDEWCRIASDNGDSQPDEATSLLDWLQGCEYISETRGGILDILIMTTGRYSEDEITERFNEGMYDAGIVSFTSREVISAIHEQAEAA